MKYFELKYILIIIIVGLIFFTLGYVVGYGSAINWAVNVFEGLMDEGYIELDIDEAFLKKGIWQYQGQIGGCLFANKSRHVQNMTGRF